MTILSIHLSLLIGQMDVKKVFLAGSIDNGTAIDWQAELIYALSTLHLPLDILNPRRKDWDSSWETTLENPLFVEQVRWELEGLERADYKLFYFAPSSLAPITLLELGLHGRQGNTIVCCSEGYWRKGNVDIVCQQYHIKQVATLKELAEAVAMDYTV